MGKHVKIENVEIPEIKNSNVFKYLGFSLAAMGILFFVRKKLKNRGGANAKGPGNAGSGAARAAENLVSVIS